jgi:tRNA-specific 2-thiouridylase
VNLQKYAAISDGMEAIVKVRYKDAGTACRLYNEADKLKVLFDADVKAVAPGQSAVFYEGDDVIGGGIIHSSFNQ